MPTLDIDMFETEPHVGNKVKVIGKIKSIDEDSGEVEVTYDKVTIVKKSKNRKDRDNDDDDDDIIVRDTMETETEPNQMNLDQALANQFGYTQ